MINGYLTIAKFILTITINLGGGDVVVPLTNDTFNGAEECVKAGELVIKDFPKAAKEFKLECRGTFAE